MPRNRSVGRAEAFAAGVPVIGSDLGGIQETLTDGVDGLLVRPFNSVAALAAAIRKIVDEPEFQPFARRDEAPS